MTSPPSPRSWRVHPSCAMPEGKSGAAAREKCRVAQPDVACEGWVDLGTLLVLLGGDCEQLLDLGLQQLPDGMVTNLANAWEEGCTVTGATRGLGHSGREGARGARGRVRLGRDGDLRSAPRYLNGLLKYFRSEVRPRPCLPLNTWQLEATRTSLCDASDPSTLADPSLTSGLVEAATSVWARLCPNEVQAPCCEASVMGLLDRHAT